MNFKELKTWQKLALMAGAVIILGLMLHFGVDAAKSIGFNQ